MTQADFAIRIGVNRSVIGAYEEGRAEPKLQTLQAICHFFEISVDQMLNERFDANSTPAVNKDVAGQNLRILPVVVSSSGEEENVVLVPEKASAGYVQGYADTEYIGNLPQFNLPFPELKAGKTYRVFQIRGDSMLPLQSGTYIICEYLTDWNDVRDNQCYVLLTRNDGIVYKRIENHIRKDGTLLLISDNAQYEPYAVHVDEILEVWKALGTISFELPNSKMDYSDLQKVMLAINHIQKDVSQLKGRF
ncbi:MAG: helix-turn-helix domain-containing protein [Flavobacteriales bacterium]|nr:helix-turn-helix domain-containing protein [Flavobacteriales bacterium]